MARVTTEQLAEQIAEQREMFKQLVEQLNGGKPAEKKHQTIGAADSPVDIRVDNGRVVITVDTEKGPTMQTEKGKPMYAYFHYRNGGTLEVPPAKGMPNGGKLQLILGPNK
jgi:hypothetical protein